MRVSLNEFETTARKAAIGLGVPTGFAQDAARAATWLAEMGLAKMEVSALSVLLQALDDSARNGCSILTLGPSAIDGFLVDSTDQVLPPCNGAALIFGLVARADPRPKRLTIKLSDRSGGILVMSVDGPALALSDGTLAGPCSITLSSEHRPGPALKPLAALHPHGIDVSQTDWHALEAYAARTLVPADARSREKGAGAGLVDRD